ncbi:MAG: S8 family serine peptidase [Candidatus Sericytochromatia bacterium]
MKNRMKQLVLATSATVTALAMVGCGDMLPNAGQNVNAANFNAAAAPGELIVKFKSVAGQQALLQNLGLKTVKKVERINAIVVTGGDTRAALSKLNADPNVAYAEPNYIAKAFDIAPSTPMMGFEGVRGGDDMLSKLGA